MIEPTVTQLRLIAAGFFVLLLLALGLYVWRRKRVASELGDPGLIRQLLGVDLAAMPWRRLTPIGLASAALALALLDPALAASRATPRGPVVLLLDASGSMLVEDVGEPRLEVQRRVARALVDELPDVPVGIVAFAGRAFSLTAPTRDRGSIAMYLAALDPTIVTQTGSGLGAAIRQGIGLLSAAGGGLGGTIVLISDGDDTDDSDAALGAAALARRERIRVHTVGIGTPQGGPVPAVDLATGSTSGYLRDPAGELIISRVGDDLLRSIASRGGGVHVDASRPDGIVTLRDEIRAVPMGGDTSEQLPRYIWFAGMALCLLLIEPIVNRPRRPR